MKFMFYFQQATPSIRLSYLANPATIPAKDSLSQPITRLAVAALEYLGPIKARNFLLEIMKEDTANKLTSGDFQLEVKDFDVSVNEVCV